MNLINTNIMLRYSKQVISKYEVRLFDYVNSVNHIGTVIINPIIFN